MNEENEQPRIIRLEETTSTNNYLRGLVGKEPLPEGSIVVTEYQTKPDEARSVTPGSRNRERI